MKINFQGSRDDHLGYGRMFIGIVDALKSLGVEVYEDQEPICEAIIWACLPNHVSRWRDTQRAMVLTMFEADHLPAGLHENIHEFDTVFVPSKQNVEMFSEFHDHVVRCPLGVDPDVWPFVQRPPIERYFNFYMPGQGARKGTDIGFKAFQAAFPRSVELDPEPRLIVKSLSDEGFGDERLEKHVGLLSSGDERALYDVAHCSINLARGEGWGLMPMQSISMGIPTILTDAHGHAEFSHLGLPIPAVKSPAGVFLYGPAGDWWEPDFDTVVETMRLVYENYDAHKRFAESAALRCHQEFNWRNSARVVMATVGRTGFADEGEWYYPANRLFKLRVSRYVDPYIGGTSYEFERNHDYYCPADVRRVIQDAGMLDVSCLEDQQGQLREDWMNLGIKELVPA